MATISWQERAMALRVDGRCLIEGQRRAAASGETFAKHSPIDGRLLGRPFVGPRSQADIREYLSANGVL